jgi:hypothetical protein
MSKRDNRVEFFHSLYSRNDISREELDELKEQKEQKEIYKEKIAKDSISFLKRRMSKAIPKERYELCSVYKKNIDRLENNNITYLDKIRAEINKLLTK